jgi:hypothetical protein
MRQRAATPMTPVQHVLHPAGLRVCGSADRRASGLLAGQLLLLL